MRTFLAHATATALTIAVGMKPLSERDENLAEFTFNSPAFHGVGMKPLSERDENWISQSAVLFPNISRRNEATL